MKNELERKILNGLTKQAFFDFYSGGGLFDKWITGEDKSVTEEDVIKEIKKLFNLPE
jgi:hypothetical protein